MTWDRDSWREFDILQQPTYPNLKELKEKLKIDENSKILVISTEGDTDPDNYRKIVWDGEFSR